MRRKCLVTDRQPNMRQTTAGPSRRRVLHSRWISRRKWQAIVHYGAVRIGKSDVEVEATQLRPGELEDVLDAGTALRSEERRVGKEWVRTCSSRLCTYHYKKKHKNIIYM